MTGQRVTVGAGVMLALLFCRSEILISALAYDIGINTPPKLVQGLAMLMITLAMLYCTNTPQKQIKSVSGDAHLLTLTH